MRYLLLAVTLTMGGAQATSQSSGVIEGRVMTTSGQSVVNAQVTLTADLTGSVSTRLSETIARIIESGNRDGVNQAAIDNAVANAQRAAGSEPGTQTTELTDADGYFRFAGLAPGRYVLRAIRDGYFGPSSNGGALSAVSKVIRVDARNPTMTATLLLTPGGVISGRIRDPYGQPATGVMVSAYRVTYNNGRKTWSMVNSRATDDRGEYRLFWLAPGEYYVGVTPRGPAVVPGPVVPGPQDSWSRTFFPGALEPERSTAVMIGRTGGEVAGIDFGIRMATTPTFKITGVAKNPYARPNPTTGVVDQTIASFMLAPREPGLLDSANPPNVANAVPANMRPNGEFEIRNVRPGGYDLYAYVLDNPFPTIGAPLVAQVQNRRYLISRTPIEVRNADVTGLTISVNPGVTLSGEVILTGTSTEAIPMENLRITLRCLSTMPQLFTDVIGGIPVGPGGKFSAANIPQERYTFSLIGLPPTAFIADVRQGGVSVSDTGFLLDDNANPVQILVDGAGSEVNGVVFNADRKPQGGAMVVLVPATRRQTPFLYKSAVSADTGGFTMRGVAPGQYMAFAWESVPPTAWLNTEYVRRYEERGKPLVVQPRASLELELNLIAEPLP